MGRVLRPHKLVHHRQKRDADMHAGQLPARKWLNSNVHYSWHSLQDVRMRLMRAKCRPDYLIP